MSAEELREYLDKVEQNRPTLRLVVGTNYKKGISQSDLAEGCGVSRTSIQNWLNRLERLETEPFDEVIYDADWPGGPAKLAEDEWEQLLSILGESPDEVGIDASCWSPRLVQLFLEDQFDVTYSRRHIREQLHQAGFTWKTAWPAYAAGEERTRGAFKEGFKIPTRRSDDTPVVVIDQPRRRLKTHLCHGWFQRDERPIVEVSEQWDAPNSSVHYPNTARRNSIVVRVISIPT